MAVVAQREGKKAPVDSYMKYLTMKNVSEKERTLWKDSLVWFYKKVLYKQQDKRLLLKSPTHTARKNHQGNFSQRKIYSYF